MKLYSSLLTFGVLSSADAFAPIQQKLYSKETNEGSCLHALQKDVDSVSREDFLSSVFIGVGVTSLPLVVVPVEPAFARGRATLEFSYERYTPRLLAGGEFYKGDLRKAVEKADWAAIKAATQEPPKRTKEDKAKIDGGVAARAAQAGGFSDARVLTAADLWAASFSDNSISTKTKNMKEQVEILREVVNGMNTAAKLALGEEKAGGFLGFGAKKPSQVELAKEVRDLYIKGGNAWNQYIYLANDELPLQLNKLPYL